MTAQLLGDTIGMAIGGTLFTITDDFRIFFLATAGLSLAVFVIAWLCIERRATVSTVAA